MVGWLGRRAIGKVTIICLLGIMILQVVNGATLQKRCSLCLLRRRDISNYTDDRSDWYDGSPVLSTDTPVQHLIVDEFPYDLLDGTLHQRPKRACVSCCGCRCPSGTTYCACICACLESSKSFSLPSQIQCIELGCTVFDQPCHDNTTLCSLP